MKKITLLLSAVLFAVMSFAASIDFSAQGYENAQVIESATIADGLVVTFDKGTNQNAAAYYNTGTAVRVYGGSTMTVTATGSTISKIVLTYGSGDKTNAITTDCGTFTTDTWTGSASSVTFTVDGTSGHRRIQAVEVTLGEGGETPETPEQPEEPTEPETPVEPETPEVPEGVITCAEAVAICEATGTTSTTESYTIQGYVTEIKTVWSEQYGNITFWMADTKDGGRVLQCYRVKPVQPEEKNVKVGDYVSVKGTLVNYYGNTPEVNAGGTYTILVAAEGGETPEEPETPSVETVGGGTEANPFTVEDVIALNNTLSGTHYVKAYIVGQVNGASLTAGAEFEAPFTPSTNSNTGVQNTYNTNLLIASSADETDPAKCVPVQLPSGDVRTNFNLPENPDMDGKLVLINGDLIKYFSVPGIKNTVSIVVLEDSEATGLENVIATDKVAKVIKNGQIYIIKGGKTYNALGAEVK